MKAGTTSLHAYLSAHPQVFMPAEKELHFFVESRAWSRGPEWYQEQFAGAGDAVAIGEASPSYSGATYYRGVPQRIRSLVPDVRLVYVVRHPVERARSMYLHQLALGKEDRPITEALAVDEPYVNTSRYRWQIDQYLEHFPLEQLLVITAENLRDDRAATLSTVHRFLGVDDLLPDGMDRERHRTETKQIDTRSGAWLRRSAFWAPARRLVPASVRPLVRGRISRRLEDFGHIPDELRRDIEGRLAEDVSCLRELLGADVDGWGFT